MKLKNIINEELRNIQKKEYFIKHENLYKQFVLLENIQLADKIYFKTGKLSEDDKKIIHDYLNFEY